MTDLHPILSRLGLAQYSERFAEEGFETWRTLLDITESDLDALGVKLGHRRILQREIAKSRGVCFEQSTSPLRSYPSENNRKREQEEAVSDKAALTGTGGKRKYRRHPKPDEKAPERPPSAYVLFSNKIREDLKSENLSFTVIAKRVGERWQDLPPKEKELFESQASAAKETYHAAMTEYKTTRSYREHQQYLAEFKARNASSANRKRPKLKEAESSVSSGTMGSQAEVFDASIAGLGHRERRVDSMSSAGLYLTTSGLPSPGSVGSAPTKLRGGISSYSPIATSSPISTSPSGPSVLTEPSAGLSQGIASCRTSIEKAPERATSGLGHPFSRILPSENRGLYVPQGSGPGHGEARLFQERPSHSDYPRRSNRVPTELQHNTSDSSSKSSIASSTMSNASTGTTSIYTPTPREDGKPAGLSLPPLASMTVLNPPGGSLFADPATKPSSDPFPSRSQPLGFLQSIQSSIGTSMTGMKFESFQLPLPFNISFGHRPSPRLDNKVKLANTFDLQDIPRERRSLKNLTLERDQRSISPTALRTPPEPRHPPIHPLLPSLPSLSSHDKSQDLTLHPDADPLSVLAYAGRMVGRENHGPT